MGGISEYEWAYADFQRVFDEWVRREHPNLDDEHQVLTALGALQEADPRTWLARREPAELIDTYVTVIHLGASGVSLAAFEDRRLRIITALGIGTST